MSALHPKADMEPHPLRCRLIAKSGHLCPPNDHLSLGACRSLQIFNVNRAAIFDTGWDAWLELGPSWDLWSSHFNASLAKVRRPSDEEVEL